METQAKQLSDYLNESLIFVNQPFKNQEELFEAVHGVAYKQGLVRDDFFERVKKRELEFPTGIQLSQMGAAIPHTDAECVLKEFIAIVINQEAIDFKCMDNPDIVTEAKIVFVLGLNQVHSQLEMLQALMATMQNTALLEELTKQNEKQKIIKLLTLKNNEEEK